MSYLSPDDSAGLPSLSITSRQMIESEVERRDREKEGKEEARKEGRKERVTAT